MKILKNIFLTFIFLSIIHTNFSQETIQSENIKLIYPTSTTEAKTEIQDYLKLHPEKKAEFKNELNGDYILLNETQYQPILNYVNSYKLTGTEKDNEFLIFKKKWFNRYFPVSRLLK